MSRRRGTPQDSTGQTRSWSGPKSGSVRPAVPFDAESILELHRSVIGALESTHGRALCQAWAPPITPLRVALAQCLLQGQSEGVWVAHPTAETSLIIGVASIEWGSGEIRAVYVHPNWSGLGVGSSLLTELELHARRRRMPALRVSCLPDAAPFYTRFGFSVVETVQVGIGTEHQLAALELKKVLLGGVARSR